MLPGLTIKNIKLSQIDFTDSSYTISPSRKPDAEETLRKSISRYGILHPPIIREIGPDTYGIVAGRKRLLALRSLQAEDGACDCQVIPCQVPEIEVFDLLLAEIQLTRQLTPVEKAIFLQKIASIMDETQIIKKFLPRMDLAPDLFLMQQTLMLLDLEESILQGLHQGIVNERVARDLVLLSARDRAALFELIGSLHLSVSNQKKLLTISKELASREKTTIARLLADDEVQTIMHHQDANPPQKTKKLMTWLERRHLPRSSQAEEEFNHFISAMQIPRNVSVGHTPFFEDDAVTLSITFRNRKSLQHVWEKIKHATHTNDN